MYYNSNKRNDNYYNAYKEELQELEAYNRQESIQKILKIVISALTILLFIFAVIYLYKYFYPDIHNEPKFIQNKELSFSIQSKKLPTSTIDNYKIILASNKNNTLFNLTNEMKIIIVQKGDTLSKLAKKAYGNYEDYTKIFAANPEIIQNPNQIFIGQRLRIPS